MINGKYTSISPCLLWFQSDLFYYTVLCDVTVVLMFSKFMYFYLIQVILTKAHTSEGFLKFKYINGLVQDCSNSIANALELLQSCTKPSTSMSYCTRNVTLVCQQWSHISFALSYWYIHYVTLLSLYSNVNVKTVVLWMNKQLCTIQ